MQGSRIESIHKRNLHRETDSIRKARARQVRLDEISDKIERAKHKSMRTNYHEKVKVLSELTSIHRVFEPLYVIQEDQERLAKNQSAVESATVPNGGYRGTIDAFAKQPSPLRRTESQNATSETRHTKLTEQKTPRYFGRKMPQAHNSNSQANAENRSLLRPRSYSWSPPSPSSDPEHYAFQGKREYIAKLRTAAVEPCVSDSMSSVTMGYLAFKRVLKNNYKRQPGIDGRFRSMSLDESQLSVIPELIEETDAGVQGTLSTQTRSAISNKDNKKEISFSRHLPAPVEKRQLCSTLSWPSRLPGTKVSLLSQDLLGGKSAEVQNEDTLVKERPALKVVKTGSSNNKEEEQNFGTADETPKLKIRFPGPKNRRIRFSEASKLIKPLGTGCFSESFQAVGQWRK